MTTSEDGGPGPAHDDEIARMIREYGRSPEPVEPRPGFEARLFQTLVEKQRALGRGTDVASSPPPRPRNRVRRFLPALIGLCFGTAAAIAIAVHGGALAPVPAAAPAMTPFPAPVPMPAGPEIASRVPARGGPERAIDAPAASGDEPRAVALPDGSTLFLDAGAEAVSEGPRALRHVRGRAFLEVAKGSAPFRVAGAGGEALAHGTKFALEASAAGLSVAVAQGRVELRPAGAKGGAVTRASGEAGRVAAGGSAEIETSPRLSHVIAWAREVFAARNAPAEIAKSRAEARRPGAGEIVILDPTGQEARLSVRHLHVDVHVEDGVARTTIDTTYFNHLPSRLEGTFYFPVPSGASISRLAMYVDGRLMEGGVASREHARNVYESIVHRRRDPALLEWMEGNVFKMRIFPLEPRQEKRVILSFVQELDALYGTYRFALPLDAGRERVKRFSIAMRLKGGAAFEAASSTYALAASREGGDLVLTHDAAEAAPRKDLIVYLADPAARAGKPIASAFAEDDGRTYVTARFRPEIETPGRGKAARGPRHFAILCDLSGSRDAVDRKAQREVIERLLAELDDGDRFRLVGFNTRVRPWKDGAFEPVRGGDVAGALRFLESSRAIGATNLEAALRDAAKAIEGVPGGHVVVVGDGIATDGERDPAALAKLLPAEVPLVGIAVGKRVDLALLSALSAAGGGALVQIDRDESLAWRVFDLVAGLNTPRLVGLEAVALDARGQPLVGEMQLSRTVAAAGDEVRAVGRFGPGFPSKIALRGRLAGKPFEIVANVEGARRDASYLPRLWARGRVESLLREGAAKHVEEITALGKSYFIATPFTSLLVLETDEMYTQFGVERGRKDRFALYPAPERVAVATEPAPGGVPVAAPSAPAGSALRSWQELEATICRRQPPLLLYRYAEGLDLRASNERLRGETWGTFTSGLAIRGSSIFLPGIEVNQTGVTPTLNPVLALFADMPAFAEDFAGNKRDWLRGPVNAFSTDADGRVLIDGVLGSGARLGYRFIPRFDGRLNWSATAGPASRDRGERAFFVDNSGVIRFTLAESGLRSEEERRSVRGWAGRYNGLGFYHRPTPQVDHRLTYDLTLLLPGLFTTDADVFALAESGAPQLVRLARRARHDPAALAFLERARAAFGARTFTVEGADGSVTEGLATADGRVFAKRRLASGLEEEIYAGPQAIFQVYAELGLAARRPRSRFHEAGVLALVPGLPPTPAALESFDMALEGERTLVLTPVAPEGATPTAIRIDVPPPDSVKGLGARVAASPAVEPDLGALVVIDMPVRSLEVATAKLTERIAAEPEEETRPGGRDALRAHVEVQQAFSALSQQQGGVPDAIRARIAGGDRRLGLYVLLAAMGYHADLNVRSGERAHPGSAVFKYLESASATDVAGRIAQRRAIGEGPSAGLVPAMALYFAALDSFQLLGSVHPRDAARLKDSFGLVDAFADRCRSGELLYGLAHQLRNYASSQAPGDVDRFVRLFDQAARAPVVADAARYDAGQTLSQSGRYPEGAKRFEEAYRVAMAEGRFPVFDWSLKQALEQVREGEKTRYSIFIDEALAWAVREERGDAILTIAESVRQTGDTVVAERALRRLAAIAPVEGQDEVTFIVARCHERWGELPQAEEHVRGLIARRSPLAKRGWLHEYAGSLAQRRGRLAQAIADLERAMALDDEGEGDVVNLAAFRQRYQSLVALYVALAGALQTTGGGEARALAPKILAAADRWRALDGDNLALYTQVAAGLCAAGAEDDAWDVASTAVERRPAEAAGYVAAGAAFEQAGRLDLAADLHLRGAAAEPTDPTPLWSAAQLRERTGDRAAARAIFERIVRGKWQDRFAGVVQQARTALGD